MIISDDLGLKASKDDPVLQGQLDDLKLIFYVVCIVFSGALLVLIGCVIGLFAWVQKLSIAQKKNITSYSTRSLGRALKPNEELAKRYTISADDSDSFNKNLNASKNPLSRQPSFKKPEPDILGNTKYNNNYKNGPGSSKHPDKRNEHTGVPMDGMHFVEDRLRDDLYY